MTSTVLVWFRRDLRLSDHPAWHAACATGARIVPVFIEEPWQRERTLWTPDLPALGSRREQFIAEGVCALQEALGGLLVRTGRPAEVLAELAKEYGAERVFCTAGHAPYEVQDEAEVAAQLALEVHEGGTLLHPEDLPFDIADLPQVFSSFRRKVEKRWTVRPVAEARTATVDVPKEAVAVQAGEVDARLAFPLHGSFQAAQTRLHHYLDGTRALSTYKETRNGLLGADYSSKFSPWLASGALGPRETYAAIRSYEGRHGANDSTYWLIFELLWRDYFAFVARQFGRRLYAGSGLRSVKPAPKWNSRAQRAFASWCAGETGQDFVDACMHELAATGFLSNRGRQVAASYLVHDLGVDWRAGAAWFEHHLIDHDPASNAGNWLYIAGRGNDPRPVRRFNPEGQAERYDPDGAYRRAWA